VKRALEQFILERSSGEFIERDWLEARIDRALAAPDVNLVVITGEPGTGKTSLMAGMAKAHPGWLRYFVGGKTGDPPATGDLSSFLLAIGHQLAHQQPMLFEPSVLVEVAVQQHVDSIEAQG
jgi:ABC-type transport system involved in cytochrome c biogenesis ATPase subunit